MNIDLQTLINSIAASSEGGEGFALMEVHPGTLIWTIIIFTILVILMGKLAWKPILKAISDRETRIREALEKADRVQVESEKAMAEHKEQAEKQRKETAEFMAKAKEDAQKTANEIVDKARKEAEEQSDRARRQIEDEKNRAIEAVRAHAVNLALDAAGHLLGKTLDDASHKAIVEDYIKSLPDNVKH
jgi:F-type H+-transporting ATPase subunit b